jgi:predicted nicotinamide N-methyase
VTAALIKSHPTENRRRELLLQRIHRRFQTVTEEIGVGATSIRFTRAADPNRVLDDIVAEEDRREKVTGVRLDDPQHLPYWAELWDSARGVAAAMAKMDLGAGTRVLDLGCGMGLCGAAAAALGAKVLLADLEPPAVMFARLNCLPFGRRVRARQLNWQIDRLRERFDLIFGADILYERKQWEFLNEFWKAHLADGGTILLGEPGRQSGDLFVPWIRERGWGLDESIEELGGGGKRIRIFELRWIGFIARGVLLGKKG